MKGDLWIPDLSGEGFVVVAGFNSTSPPPDTLLHQYQSATQPFAQTFGMAVDSVGNIIATDDEQSRVVVLAGLTSVTPPFGTQLGSWSSFGNLSLSNPHGVCLDAKNNIYVSDSANDRLLVLASMQSKSPTPGTLLFALALAAGSNPRGCCIDGVGNIYTMEFATGNISILAPITSATPGALLHRFTDLSTPFTSGALRTCALDTAGYIYATDLVGQRVAVLYPLTSVHPLGTQAFSFNNSGDPWQQPEGVAVDSAGRFYVADYNDLVGRVTINAGINSVSPAPGTELYSVQDLNYTLASAKQVALDAAGNIYISDYNIARVDVIAGLAVAAVGGAKGDPLFKGFRGQSYQVHGLAGAVYSIISAPSFQLNARFTFLASGGCPVYAAATDAKPTAGQCWTHPGSYFGELGVRTEEGSTLRIVAGSGAHGFVSVEFNGVDLLSAHGHPVLHSPGQKASLTVSVVDRHHIVVQHGVFTLFIDNSDQFVNLGEVRIASWVALVNEVQPHGLLGQTWRQLQSEERGKEVPEVQGAVDDYVDQNDDLFGCENVYCKLKLRAA